VVEHHRRTENENKKPKHLWGDNSGLSSPGWRKLPIPNNYTDTIGWQPACSCYGVQTELPPLPIWSSDEKPSAEYLAELERINGERERLIALWATLETVPQTVLDMFGGSGTTARAAVKLGRKAILIELSKEYAELQAERTTVQREMNI
jgi:hypothetical protein